ncbi:MAG: guanylate kinase [Clostridia bacterium]|nr:guanylate kinase [Clostridia bacterium]
MKNKGNLFVISGPSGVGKGTICRRLIGNSDNVSVSVSATTRNPRSEDVEGVTYYFKTIDEFKKMIDEGKFLEWAVYNGNYYGTPADAIENKISMGEDIILEIEAQGAMKVMESKPDAVSIFITPPNEEALYQRLKNRGTESDDEIKKRVEAARWELEQQDKYDHIVVNDDLDKAVSAIENIMKNERKND